MTDTVPAAGRIAQRRRTRTAIVAATSRLLAAGGDPSIAEIAAAADVSRRTVYMYFPTLDQLLLDATLGAMSTDIDAVLAGITESDPRIRLELMFRAICRSIDELLPLGRKLIRLTVDHPPQPGAPRRGYRRVGWIEQAIEPMRAELGAARFEDLVSALAMVIGWEPFVVLYDIRGLDAEQAQRVALAAALSLIDAAVAAARADAGQERPGAP